MKHGNKKSLQFLLVFSILFAACEDEATTPIIEINPYSGIDLENIEVGNEARYALYQSGCNQGFAFTGDTLVVRVEERNDSTFLHEFYTPGSTLDGSVSHPIISREGYVLIPQRAFSQFLFFYGNDTIFLDRKPTVKLEQVGCKLFHDSQEFVGDFIGSLTEFQFGNIMIKDRKGISCVPTILDIDAYILYESHLNMVHIIQEADEVNISGFIAID